jgi:DNA-binding MarR family transcriptional regulator
MATSDSARRPAAQPSTRPTTRPTTQLTTQLTTRPTTQLGAPDQRDLIDALVTTSFATMALLNRIAAEHDLSLTQIRVLAILRDRRVKMSELAGYLGLDKSTITGLVDRAEKRGLLQRTPNPADGRAVDVMLSAEGMELAERGATEIARSLSPMTSTLTPADAHRLTALLERMLARAEQLATSG